MGLKPPATACPSTRQLYSTGRSSCLARSSSPAPSSSSRCRESGNSWWVETVSLGNSSRSRSSTRRPARASTVAVAEPAHRAPTTMTSYCSCSSELLLITHSSVGRGPQCRRAVEGGWKRGGRGSRRRPLPPPRRGGHARVDVVSRPPTPGSIGSLAAVLEQGAPGLEGLGPSPGQSVLHEDPNGVSRRRVGGLVVTVSGSDGRPGQLDLTEDSAPVLAGGDDLITARDVVLRLGRPVHRVQPGQLGPNVELRGHLGPVTGHAQRSLERRHSALPVPQRDPRGGEPPEVHGGVVERAGRLVGIGGHLPRARRPLPIPVGAQEGA